MPHITVLRKRADFLRAAESGFKFVKFSVIVQSRKRTTIDSAPASEIRIGFTATRNVGNAVIRNRTKRRMRAAVAKLIPEFGLPGCDYVIIGRVQTRKERFTVLLRDMRHCLKRLADQMQTLS